MNVAIAASIVALSVVALVLAGIVLWRFRREQRLWHLYWGAGIFLVFITLAEESGLYVGLWSQLLVRSYFILVALLVGVLSLGSAELALKARWKYAWFGFVGVAGAASTVIGALTPVQSSVLSGGVVVGVPYMDLVASSLVTIPSSLLLIITSLYGVIRQKRLRLLYITVGTALIAFAGGLYLVNFPATLYYAEFIGVVLLFFGFVNVAGRPTSQPSPSPT
jgi:hypothetical protein